MSGSGPEVDRRRFLALAGASLALAKMTACTRQPPEKIVPYVKSPEELIGGTSLRYATSMLQCGLAAGLVVRSQMGRPIKVEGNPDHPASLGATDAFAQASIFSLCDPARSKVATRFGRIVSHERALTELRAALTTASAAGGRGARILTESVTSPTLGAELAAFLSDYPEARWHRFEPCGQHHTRRGLTRAFGEPLHACFDLLAADVIVCIDSDLAALTPGAVRYARDLARRRAPGDEGALGHTSFRADASRSLPMNRVYSVESSPTCTGSVADHRLFLRPTDAVIFVAALFLELTSEMAPHRDLDVPVEIGRWARAVAADLRRAGSRGLVVAGEPAPPAVHVLVAAMNEALGAVGSTVRYIEPPEPAPVDHLSSVRELVTDMQRGQVSLLVILGGNPVYTAPPDLDFPSAMASVPVRAHLSLYPDETSGLCHYQLPEAHFLESWGDARAFDGTVSLLQPLIEPLYSGLTALEVVASLRGAPAPALARLRAHWQRRLPPSDFDAAWNNALRTGIVPGTASPERRPSLAPGAVEPALEEAMSAARPRDGYELAIRPDHGVFDGRHANNPWLQELPRPHTSITWENVAILGPRSAADLQVTTGDVVELAVDGRSVRAPVFVVLAHPEDTLTVHLGYGRRAGGELSAGLGFDAYRLRTSEGLWSATSVLIRKTGERQPLAFTKGSTTPHDRPIARVVTEMALAEDPGVVRAMDEEAGHSMLSIIPEWRYEAKRQWGMAIDQSACTGCSACVVACQSENNSPVVGKEQVRLGREMQWLRIDRYEVPHGSERITVHQPMMCVHCEAAPCEYVCPVEATTHSAEGINEMTYNRCVGTRYCSNNCPYKVRRFNFLPYHEPEITTIALARNPEVTVRTRGVMEKCTYCIQRVAAARIDSERERRPIADGELMTACQQACPTGAITFGDLRDPASRVLRLHASPRAYKVLGGLNTRPRTSHLASVRNRNPELDPHG
ncbi:MAG: 4Fe-4S dicluster domain-containing protein [Polyangiaceae bacterium]